MELSFMEVLGFLHFDGMVCVFAVALIAVLGSFTRRTVHACDGCGHVNRPQARFCAQCGQALAD